MSLIATDTETPPEAITAPTARLVTLVLDAQLAFHDIGVSYNGNPTNLRVYSGYKDYPSGGYINIVAMCRIGLRRLASNRALEDSPRLGLGCPFYETQVPPLLLMEATLFLYSKLHAQWPA